MLIKLFKNRPNLFFNTDFIVCHNQGLHRFTHYVLFLLYFRLGLVGFDTYLFDIQKIYVHWAPSSLPTL